MSEKTSAAMAAAVRAAMLDPSKFAGPRQPTYPLPLVQRLAGGEMLSWCVTTDLQAVFSPLLRYPLGSPCIRAIERAMVAVSIVTIARAERVLRQEALRRDLPPGVCPVVQAAVDVLVFHMAELGCRLAAARIASQALANAHLAVQTGRLDRAFLYLRHALFRTEEAEHGRGEDAEIAAGPFYGFLESFDVRAGLWLQAVTAFETADKMVEDEHDILRGGVGMVAPPPSDLADLDLILGAAAEAKANAAAGRTLVVFPSLDHLPLPSKASQDRGSSPRALCEELSGKPLPLTPAPDPATFAAELNAAFPWARDVTEQYAMDLVGASFASIRPRTLVGGAGGGKTSYARAVFRALGLQDMVHSAGGQMDGGGFSGTSRTWSTWRLSVPAQGCLRFRSASLGIVIDEIEKASPDRRYGRLDETLLPYLERTAGAIQDPALECPLDLSGVSYVLTANIVEGVARPLLDRAPPVQWPMPRREDMPIVAAAILAEIREEQGLDPAWCPDLDGDELDALSAWKGGSLRPLRRMVRTVVASRDLFARRLPN